MSETDFAAFERKDPGDRTVMHVLYGLHTFAPFTYWVLAIIAMVVNYVKRADELDAVYASHHNYMIATFWWSLLWLLVGLWYLYRCIRGWLRFTDGRPPT
jgi:uncharacterized membrane protein